MYFSLFETDLCKIFSRLLYMHTLELLSLKEAQQDKNIKPISIIKGDERNPSFNKFLCLKETKEETITKEQAEKILTPDLMYQVLPPVNAQDRSIWYIAGASGSGKSYQAKIIISNYKKLFPDRPVFLISKLTSDETLDSLKYIQRVDLVEFCQQPFDVEDTEPCLIIFDDFETLEKKQLQVVLDAINDISILGRHKTISMIYISHHLTNYKSTKLILNESHNIIVFPQNTSFLQLKYLLENYGNMDPNEIKKLRKLGRWVCIYTQYPNYVISQSSAYLLHQE